MVFGTCPLAGPLMASLELTDFETKTLKAPRFRDCYPVIEDGEWVIHLLTRVGGDNRPDYQDEIAELRAHPQYMRDYDEPYDTTYATFVMRPTEAVAKDLKQNLKPEQSTKPFEERWLIALNIINEKQKAAKAKDQQEN